MSSIPLPPAPDEADVPTLYFLVSRPRHSANCTALVPGKGAQSRSMGGKICLWRYQSISGIKVLLGLHTSCGAKARLAEFSLAETEQEEEEVRM